MPKDEIMFRDNQLDLAIDSDDSVYNSSNQSVDRKLEAHLRAAKLTKVICKDKRITATRRQDLKIRRNIIKFRARESNQKKQDELVFDLIPKTR